MGSQKVSTVQKTRGPQEHHRSGSRKMSGSEIKGLCKIMEQDSRAQRREKLYWELSVAVLVLPHLFFFFSQKRKLSINYSGGSDGKESTCNVGDWGLIPGLRKSPEGNGNPLQYSCLENPMDRGA